MSKKLKAKLNKAKDVETKPMPRQQQNHLQALQFIDQCVAMAPLGRTQHVQAQQALQQLSGALGELERLKNEPRQVSIK